MKFVPFIWKKINYHYRKW